MSSSNYGGTGMMQQRSARRKEAREASRNRLRKLGRREKRGRVAAALHTPLRVNRGVVASAVQGLARDTRDRLYR
jgi:hypothetical protein